MKVRIAPNLTFGNLAHWIVKHKRTLSYDPAQVKYKPNSPCWVSMVGPHSHFTVNALPHLVAELGSGPPFRSMFSSDAARMATAESLEVVMTEAFSVSANSRTQSVKDNEFDFSPIVNPSPSFVAIHDFVWKSKACDAYFHTLFAWLLEQNAAAGGMFGYEWFLASFFAVYDQERFVDKFKSGNERALRILDTLMVGVPSEVVDERIGAILNGFLQLGGHAIGAAILATHYGLVMHVMRQPQLECGVYAQSGEEEKAPIHVECSVSPPAPTVSCNASCVVQSGPDFPFERYPLLMKILAQSDSPRDFRGRIKLRDKKLLDLSACKVFFRDCERHTGHFGHCRSYARQRLAQHRLVVAQGAADIISALNCDSELAMAMFDIVLFIYSTYTMDNAIARLAHVRFFFSSTSGQYWLLRVASAVDDLLSIYSLYQAAMYVAVPAEGALDEVGEGLGKISKISKAWKTPLFSGIFSILATLVGVQLFGVGSKAFVARELMANFSAEASLGFWPNVEKVFTVLKRCYDTGDLWTLFESDDASVWTTKAIVMIGESSDLLEYGVPPRREKGRQRADAGYWLGALRDHLRATTTLKQSVPDFHRTYLSVVTRIAELDAIVNANGSQVQPPLVVFYGPPGCGKSQILGDLVNLSVPIDFENVPVDAIRDVGVVNTYRRSNDPKQKYMQGYSTQAYFVLEDIHGARVDNNFPSTVTELVNVYSTRFTMASVEDKARVVSRAKAVFATTNQPFITVPEFDMVQVARRISFVVDVRLTKEVTDYMLSRGMNPEDGPYKPGPWYYEVHGVQVDLRQPEYLDMGFDEWISRDLPDFLFWDRLSTWVVMEGAQVDGHRLTFDQGKVTHTFKSRASFMRFYKEYYENYRRTGLVNLKRQTQPVCEFGFPFSAHRTGCKMHDGECRAMKEEVAAQGFEEVKTCVSDLVSFCQRHSAVTAYISIGLGAKALIDYSTEKLRAAIGEGLIGLSELLAGATRALVDRFNVFKFVKNALCGFGIPRYLLDKWWLNKIYSEVCGRFAYVATAIAIGASMLVAYRMFGETEKGVDAEGVVVEDTIQKLRQGELAELEIVRRENVRSEPVVATNPWHSPYDAFTLGSIPKGHTLEQLGVMIASNQHEVRVQGANTPSRRAYAFKLTATTFAVPRHLATVDGKLDDCLVMRLGPLDDRVTFRSTVLIELGPAGNARDAPELDLLFVDVPASPGRGLLEYFPDEIGGLAEVWREGKKLGPCDLRSRVKVVVRDSEGKAFPTPSLFAAPGGGLENGACGLLYYGELRGSPIILGLHISSMDDKGLFSFVSKKRLSPLCTIGKVPELSKSAQAYLTSAELGPLSPNSDVTTIKGLPAVVLGTVKELVGRRDVSQVERTSLYDAMAKYSTKEFSPPFMGKGKMVGDEWLSPFINKFAHAPQQTPPSVVLIRDAATDYMTRIKPSVCTPLSDYEMFSGSGESYCGSLVLSTSMGPPYTKLGLSPKTKLVQRGPEEYKVDPLLANVLVETEKQLSEGPVWVLAEITLKDEPVSMKKFDTANTRLFSVVAGDFNMLGRKYLLPLMRLFYEQREESGMMPGINAFGKEWDTFFHRLDKYDGHFGCDQKKFDAHHMAAMFQVVSEEMGKFSLKCGYTAVEAKIVENLVLSCIYQIMIYKGDVFILMLGLGSGLWFTTFFNCFVNSMLIFACFKLRLGAIPKFDFGTFGDDLLVGIDRSVGYDQLMLREDMALFGYEITSADKDSDLQPYDDLKTTTFLKRGFKWHSTLGRMVAPIERDSIYRMLCWRMHGDFSEIERCNVVCDTAMVEACLHGEEYFEWLGPELEQAMSGAGFVWKAPSWAETCAKLAGDYPDVAVLAQGAGTQNPLPVGSRLVPGNPLKTTSYTAPNLSYMKRGRGSLEFLDLESRTRVTKFGRARQDQKIMSSTDLNSNNPYSPPETIVGNIEMQMEVDEKVGLIATAVPNMVVENPQLGMLDMLKRPVKIYQWTVTDTVVPSGVNFFYTWLAQALPQRYLTPYVYLRGTLKLRFDVSGTPFQFGNMTFWAYPQPPPDFVSFGSNSRVQFDGNKPYQPYQVPHICIDLAAVGSYELSVPLASSLGWINIRNTAPVNGSVVWGGYLPTTPLQTVSPPFRPFNVNVYAWMEDVEVSVSAQSEREAASATKGLGSVVDKFKRMTAAYASPLQTTLELLSAVPTPVSQAMGFSKPLVTDQVGAVVARANTDFAATSNSRFFGYRSGTDPLGGVAIPPAAAGFKNADETSIGSIAARWGLLGVYPWAPANLTNTVLSTTFVNPATVPYDQNAFWTTPLSMAAAPFNFWGGGLEYKITVWASPFHKGTLRIVHSPLGAAPSNDASRAESKVVEVCGKTEFVFCADWKKTVPFITVTDSVAVKPMSPTLVNTFKPLTGASYNNNVNNGAVYILVDAPLISSNATVPPVYYTIEVRACPDFRVARPSITNLNSYRVLQATMAGTVFVASNKGGLLAQPEGEPSVEAQSGMDVPFRVAMGEVIADFKELAKVATPFITYSPIGPNSPVDAYIAAELAIPAYPPIPSNAGTAADGPFAIVVDSNSCVSYTGFTFSSWAETMFHAQRGGYRYAIQSFGNTKTWLAAGGGWAVPGSGVQAWSMNTATGPYTQGYSLFEGVNSDLTTPISNQSHGLYEIEMPSMNPTFFRNAQASTFWTPGMVSSIRGPVFSVRQSTFSASAIDTETALPPITIWASSADDYSLAGFAFCPILRKLDV